MSERYQEDPWEHGPAVSAVYRKTTDLAPPASLDDAILAEAKRAVWRRKQRWILPFSTAAVVVVSVTLLMKMNHEWEFSDERESNAPTSQPLPATQTTEPGRLEKPTRPYLSGPPAFVIEEEPRPESAEAVTEQNASVGQSSIEAKTSKAAPASRGLAPATTLNENTHVSSEEQKQAGSPVENTGVLSFSEDVSPLLDSAEPEAGKMEEDAPPALSKPKKEILRQERNRDTVRMERSEQDQLDPLPWLKKIRELVAAERTEAARKELESFKKRYPDYPLPEDLKLLNPLKRDTTDNR